MGSTSTQTQKSEMDPFQKEVLQYGFDYAKKNIVDQPFQRYEGDVVSGLTDVEKGLLERYLGMDTGQAAYGAASDVASSIAQETPEQRMARVKQYSDMYSQNVIDPTIQAMDYQRAKDRLGEYATRTGAKAFGSRGDVYLGAKEGEYETNLLNTVANLRNMGLDFGTQTVSAEDQRRLGAAGQLASTAGAGLQAELTGLGAMSGAAALPRGIEDIRKQFDLSEFMRQQNLPLQKLGAIGAVGSMIPAGLGTVTGTESKGGLGPALGALGSVGMAMTPFGGLGGLGGMIGGSSFANPLFGGAGLGGFSGV